MPVTTPDDTPTVTFELLALQVPPKVVLLKTVLDPTQTLVAPVIAKGKGNMDTDVVVWHPVPSV